MNEMTLPELTREVGRLDRRFSDTVSKAVYEANVGTIKDDIAEIRDSQKWAMRLIAGQFVALIIALLFYALQQAQLP
jgi:hypothetical protein